MARSDTPEPMKIKLPGSETEVSIKKARAVMARLTDEANDLRDDESSGAKSERIRIAKELRTIQRRIDETDELVDVEVPIDASKQFPFVIGSQEFWPGTHKVRGQVAMILRYMMDQHRAVEQHIHVAGGNVDPNAPGILSLGRDLGAV